MTRKPPLPEVVNTGCFVAFDWGYEHAGGKPLLHGAVGVVGDDGKARVMRLDQDLEPAEAIAEAMRFIHSEPPKPRPAKRPRKSKPRR